MGNYADMILDQKPGFSDNLKAIGGTWKRNPVSLLWEYLPLYASTRKVRLILGSFDLAVLGT